MSNAVDTSTSCAEPPCAPKRDRPRMKWQYVYFLLAAFAVFAVSLSLLLNHQLVQTHKRTVQKNLQWVSWLKQCDALSKQAGAINVQGSDVLTSHDVPLESREMDAALSAFNQILSTLRSELLQNVSPVNVMALLKDCSSIRERTVVLTGRIDSLFSLARDGRFDQAQSKITLMNRDYDGVLRALDSLRSHLRAQREAYLEAQIAGANALQRYEWLLGLLVVVMVTGVTVYGVRLDRHVSESEAQIREAQERYRSLVEQSTDGILIADDNWNLRFANQAACQMFGYTHEEMVHLNVEDTYLVEDRDLAARRKQEICTGDSARYERVVLRKDGSRFHAEVIVRRLDQGGSQAIFRDITERRRAEEQLRLQSTALAAAVNAIVITDCDGTIRWVNPAFTTLTGYTREEVIGTNPHVLKSGKHDAAFYAELWRTVKAGNVWHGELINRRKDGSEYTEEMTITPVRDERGEVTYYIAIKQEVTDRRRAEAALHASEKRYRTLFEGAAEGILVADIESRRFNYANQAICSMLGYTAEELTRLGVADIHPKETLDHVATEFEAQVRDQKTLAPDIPCLRKDGSVFYTDIVSAVVVIDGRKCSLGFFTDITERKRAEEALQKSEADYRALVETTNTGFVVIDYEGNVLDANAEYVRLTGHCDLNEIRGRNVVEWTADYEKEKNAEAVRMCFKHGYIRDLEIDYVDSHGNVTPIEINATVAERGGTLQILTLCRDITERKRAGEALCRSEGKFRGLFESSRDALMTIEPPSWRFTSGNPATVKMFGAKNEEEFISHGPWELSPERQPDGRASGEKAKEMIETTVREGSHFFEWTHRRIGGEEFPADVLLTRMERDGEVIVQATVRDITERKRAEDALQETNRRLENALDELKAAHEQAVQQERLSALGTMASGIAHDFNNALVGILGLSELLLDRPENLDDKEKARRYLEMINTSAKDAGDIVNRLREFYRHREENEPFAPLDLNELVNQAISLTQPKWRAQAEACGNSIDVRTDLQAVPAVAGKVAELREALTNLILNAADAMPQGGTIGIGTRRDGDQVIVEVSDTGSGMTDEVRRRCLEPFYTTKGSHGTGLGLSMVYGIVQRHQGTIDIKTEIGKGSIFIVHLPCQVAVSRPEDPLLPTNPLRDLHVLLVDDEAIVRKVIGEYLKIDGHTVEAATGGHDGVEKFHAGRFDLVVVDRAMPDMNGDQVATAIKSANPAVPVVMLTGFGEMMEVAGEKPVGVDLVVNKPVTIDGLRRAVAKAVGNN